MSDRIAVFDKGRIQQLDRPAAIYERPTNEFVAGFVGISNLISGDAAERLIGKRGTFTVRPEKIAIDAHASDSRTSGTIKEVEYLGPSTRFLVDLDVGVSLMVLRQNSEESAFEVEGMRGKKVSLNWDKSSEYQVS